jgi:hypothetical protein
MGMKLLEIFLTFILVTVAGNYLLSSWQYRSWVKQKRFEIKAVRVSNIEGIFDDLIDLMNRRRYAMLSIVYALRQNDEERVRSSTQAYSGILTEWNTRLNTILVKIRYEVGRDEMRELDEVIVPKFVKTGSALEECLRDASKASKAHLVKIEIALNYINHQIILINSTIYAKLRAIQHKDVHTDPALMSDTDYADAPLWALFRNLFKVRM